MKLFLRMIKHFRTVTLDERPLQTRGYFRREMQYFLDHIVPNQLQTLIEFKTKLLGINSPLLRLYSPLKLKQPSYIPLNFVTTLPSTHSQLSSPHIPSSPPPSHPQSH
jgi:hypothetical protein